MSALRVGRRGCGWRHCRWPGTQNRNVSAAEFSGTGRTVAEYLLAEVLDRQSEQVRRLLLRTSILERVNGDLADLLAGGSGGERVLQDLEQANAFVTSPDVTPSWFRYHHLFGDLLRLAPSRARLLLRIVRL
jgi:LuxR family transcriptional regulator, maltose regulon positive regulatory protein